jgi:ribulose 1,5-bisphosphate synthetase/thiazole synthase
MSYSRVSIIVISLIACVWVGSMFWSPLHNRNAVVGSTPAVQAQEANPSLPLTPTLLPNGDVVLFDFEDTDEVARFVYGGVNTFIEAESRVVRTGKGSCSVTYYVGATKQNKRAIFYTLMYPARGRLGDWSPYSEFQTAIFNKESFTVTLDVEYADGNTSVWRRYNLPPKVWSRLKQPLSDLKAEGLDLSKVKRIGWSQLDTEMVDINTLYLDDIRLTGADLEASRRVVQAAWAAYEDYEQHSSATVRAPYVPIIKKDTAKLTEIKQNYNCGDITGYIETKVLVVGGGIAGSSAAIASGKMGVDTLLIEQYSFLGGSATASMVQPFASNRVGNEDLVKGVFQDISQALLSRGFAKRDTHNPGVIYFDDEGLKFVLNNLVIRAGTKLMLSTWAEKPLVRNNVCEGIIVDNKSGRLAILAKVVIDSTGDGDVAAGAGCPFEMGRGYDQYTQATTLFFRMGGVNTEKAFYEQTKRVQRPDGAFPPEYMYGDLFRKAVADGRFPADIPIGSIYFEKTLQDDVVSVNATKAFEVDATDVNDLTYASVETRRQAVELADFLEKNVPGFENSYLLETGMQVGIRESRRIKGEYQLSGSDVLHAEKFPDVIARGAYGVDIHIADPSGGGVVGLTLKPGTSYDIPYRCLVPLGVDNLLLAGRCISVSHVALGSVRIMAISSGTGQASGVAAALCAQKNVTPRNLPYVDLRQALLDQGADLD